MTESLICECGKREPSTVAETLNLIGWAQLMSRCNQSRGLHLVSKRLECCSELPCGPCAACRAVDRAELLLFDVVLLVVVSSKASDEVPRGIEIVTHSPGGSPETCVQPRGFSALRF